MGTSLAEVLETHGRSLKAAIHTSLPAKVVAYDPVTNIVNAQPMIKAAFFLGDGEREYDTLPVVPFPVLWPRFGGKVVRGLLEPGDHVLLVFSEAGLAEWRATGQLSEPKDARRLSIGYGFAMPGAEPDSNPMTPADALEIAAGALIIGEDGGDQILVGGLIPGIRLGKTAVMPIAKAPAVIAAFTALSAAIGAQATVFTGTGPAPVLGAALGTSLAAIVTALGTAIATLTADCPSSLTKSE